MTELGATALTLVALATLGPPTAAWQREAALDVAPMPDHWVPFSATIEIVNPTNRWVGRFHRGADGSTRSETRRPAGPVESIVIKNYEEGMQYWWNRRIGWTSGLVERPPGWPKPLMMSGKLYRRLKKKDVPIEGFEVLMKVTPDGTDLIAPQLNGFVLAMRRNGCGPGCGTFFHHIKVGDQPASLFQPDPPE